MVELSVVVLTVVALTVCAMTGEAAGINKTSAKPALNLATLDVFRPAGGLLQAKTDMEFAPLIKSMFATTGHPSTA